mmetsp:Transcript_14121/g.36456  ORF Transcript_14121/g.36456 Transcript_14121/m.36456 type:complete len:269 (-) Transcript_14121:893-1699(-)
MRIVSYHSGPPTASSSAVGSGWPSEESSETLGRLARGVSASTSSRARRRDCLRDRGRPSRPADDAVAPAVVGGFSSPDGSGMTASRSAPIQANAGFFGARDSATDVLAISRSEHSTLAMSYRRRTLVLCLASSQPWKTRHSAASSSRTTRVGDDMNIMTKRCARIPSEREDFCLSVRLSSAVGDTGTSSDDCDAEADRRREALGRPAGVGGVLGRSSAPVGAPGTADGPASALSRDSVRFSPASPSHVYRFFSFRITTSTPSSTFTMS